MNFLRSATLASTIAFSACDGAPNDTPEPLLEAGTNCNQLASSFSIKDRMGQAVSTFTAGETVTFETRVTNAGSTHNTLTLNGGCNEVNFEVVDASKRQMWISPCSPPNHLCLCASSSVTYAPGETRVITADWNQQDHGGTQIPTGQYTANALDGTTCSPALDKSAGFGVQ